MLGGRLSIGDGVENDGNKFIALRQRGSELRRYVLESADHPELVAEQSENLSKLKNRVLQAIRWVLARDR